MKSSAFAILTNALIVLLFFTKYKTTGGKKRRLKRKNKTKKGGKTPKETYYKYSPNTGKRIRVTTKKNKK